MPGLYSGMNPAKFGYDDISDDDKEALKKKLRGKLPTPILTLALALLLTSTLPLILTPPPPFPPSHPAPLTLGKFAEEALPKFLGWFSDALSATEGPFFCGDKMTIADLVVLPQLKAFTKGHIVRDCLLRLLVC